VPPVRRDLARSLCPEHASGIRRCHGEAPCRGDDRADHGVFFVCGV